MNFAPRNEKRTLVMRIVERARIVCILALGVALSGASGCDQHHHAAAMCAYHYCGGHHHEVSSAISITDATVAPAVESVTSTENVSGELDPLIVEANIIQGRVGNILRLPFKKKVTVRLLHKNELIDVFTKEIDREMSAEEIVATSRSLIRLRLAPPGFNLKEVMLPLLRENVGGFYLPHNKALYLIRGTPMQAMISAHELTHALQDQYFDLEPRMKAHKQNDDAAAAFQSLVEGEATLLMSLYQAKHVTLTETLRGAVQSSLLSAGQQASMQRVPLFMREQLMFPYLSGQAFVAQAFGKGGWVRVRELYERGPESTEQILHPGKFYTKIDRPTIISLLGLTKTLGKKWQRVHENTLGELMVSVLLRTLNVEQETANTAARGWDGDRYLLLSRPEAGSTREAIVWLSTWDSARHANRFLKAYRQALTQTLGAPAASATPHRVHWAATGKGGRRVSLIRWGQEVLLLDGFSVAEEKTIRQSLSRHKKAGTLFTPDRRADGAPTTEKKSHE